MVSHDLSVGRLLLLITEPYSLADRGRSGMLGSVRKSHDLFVEVLLTCLQMGKKNVSSFILPRNLGIWNMCFISVIKIERFFNHYKYTR